MSSSSPSDLAVTFRSIPRRLREAVGDAPPEATSVATAELNEQIAAAARLADEWNEDTLNALRGHALDIGRLLRAIAAIAEGDD
jgi:hypothetical protein